MIEIYKQAELLPPEWDTRCADNYALKREFLSLLEKANPCDQQYYIFRTPDMKADSILMTFRALKCNITMFTPLTYRVNVIFVHLPVSITRPGFVIGDATKGEVDMFLRTLNGYVIVLNGKPGLNFPGFANAYTCSEAFLKLRWDSFTDYVNSMRSHYRYRIKRALAKGRELSYHLLPDNRAFDQGLYSLYEAVHAKSNIKIEKLGIDFFRHPMSKIIVCKLKDKSAGFIQLIENNGELIFAFVGIDYNINSGYDTYLNLLLYMVKYGIEKGFKIIELGQTAEDTKLRLGGNLTPLCALLYHSNPMINWFIHRIKKIISYKEPVNQFNIFKNKEKIL